jgi:hypothetical protein
MMNPGDQGSAPAAGEQPAPGAAPGQDADDQAGQDQGGQQDPSKVLSTVQLALNGIQKAVMGAKQIPPEAQKHLQMAVSEYNAFMKITGKAMGVQMPGEDPSMGDQSADAQGNSSAVPADQPMRAGARPVMS